MHRSRIANQPAVRIDHDCVAPLERGERTHGVQRAPGELEALPPGADVAADAPGERTARDLEPHALRLDA